MKKMVNYNMIHVKKNNLDLKKNKTATHKHDKSKQK